MSKHCHSCGVKINRKNSYPNRKRRKGYRRLCKLCDNKRRTEKNQSYGKKSRLLLKGKYRKISITFLNQEAKKHFLLCRRLQVIGCHPKVGHESKVGQRVEHLVEIRDNETKELHRYYTETVCDECEGEVQFNVHGFKQCVSCGLLSANYTLINELDTPQARDLPQEEYYSHAGPEGAD